MARRKSERFQILQKLADQYENIAAKHLGASAKNLADQEQRLSELKRFREDYVRQFNENGAAGMSGASLQSYQKFISQLDTAIAQQNMIVDSARTERHHKQHIWEDKHKTRKVYEKTIERFEQKEQKEQSRREQHEQDDRKTGIKQTD